MFLNIDIGEISAADSSHFSGDLPEKTIPEFLFDDNLR
jgi:hypothetical protein